MSEIGKGDKPRPLSISYEEYAKRFDRIFGHDKETIDRRVEENSKMATFSGDLGCAVDDQCNHEHK